MIWHILLPLLGNIRSGNNELLVEGQHLEVILEIIHTVSDGR